MKIFRNFYIKVEENGKQIPIMDFFPPQYSILSNLGLSDFAKSETITKVLQEIKEALRKNENYVFAQDDWCIVEVKGEKSTVENGFDEFPPFEVETSFIIELLSDWRDFLIKFENKQIPGLL
ncbi:MAG: hypothetical protein LBT27_00410 [Prevotellaceae bacterium]|jgi:hypothetical protein|nr:hypothetical protein [Prevotellaceae bacterium]